MGVVVVASMAVMTAMEWGQARGQTVVAKSRGQHSRIKNEGYSIAVPGQADEGKKLIVTSGSLAGV